MSADLEIVTERQTDVLLVPLTAITTRAGQRTVRLASGEVRAIRTGATDGMRIEVLEGVEEGDQLIVPSLLGNVAEEAGGSPLPIGPPGRRSSSRTGGGGGPGGPPP
jgi:hypothetical protein